MNNFESLDGALVLSSRNRLGPQSPKAWQIALYRLGVLHLTHPHLVFMVPRRGSHPVERTPAPEATPPNEAKTK